MSKGTFKLSDLIVVEQATHEPIVLGDFVRLASGSPPGLIIGIEQSVATVVWFANSGERSRSVLPAVCLRPIVAG